MPAKKSVNLGWIVAEAGEHSGTVWTLTEGEQLNVNLVRFSAGRGVGDHVNDEVDVLIVGVSGSGVVAVDGEEYALVAGNLVFVAKGDRRAVRSASDDFAYLSVHRRRGALGVGRKREDGR